MKHTIALYAGLSFLACASLAATVAMAKSEVYVLEAAPQIVEQKLTSADTTCLKVETHQDRKVCVFLLKEE